MSDTTLLIIFAILLLPGLIGIIIPILPGIPYMFLIAVIFGFIDRWVHLTGFELLGLLLIALLSFLVDYSAGVLGARWGGASKRSLLYGLGGLLIGLFLAPPFGSLIGLFIGIFLGEISQRRERRQALKAATGSLLGTVGGIGLNLALAILFITFFIILARA